MYSNKTQFLEALKAELLKRNINDNEILEDFEQHFNIGLSEGLSEEQVCAKLGNPAEIANQYAPEGYTEQVNTAKTNTANNTSNAQANYNSQPAYAENDYSNGTVNAPTNNSDADIAKIVGVVCLDVFVLTWAIPTLFSLLISYWGVMISFFVTPVIMLVHFLAGSQIFGSMIYVSMLTPAAGIFAALILFGIALIMSAFCISIWKGFGKLLQAIGRLHYTAFTGKKATF